ncbi:MAG: type III pantothenate kinase [Candidatus Pelagibacter sp.]
MYLIGDIGNTDTKICLFNSDLKLIKQIRIKTTLLNKKYIVKKLRFIKKYKSKSIKILFSSVVPIAYKEIKKSIENLVQVKCDELKKLKFKKLLKINVNKKQIGSDRLANAISVIDKKNNFIVVDFGTATNFDVIIKDVYIGGILAPGVDLSLNTLSDKASLIPKIKLEKAKSIIGKNTISAIRAGFYYGYVGLIDNIIKMIIKQTGKSFNIILTGGYSHLFKNSIKKKTIIKKNLTINGVLKAAVLSK